MTMSHKCAINAGVPVDMSIHCLGNYPTVQCLTQFLAAKSKLYLLVVGLFALTEIDKMGISGVQTRSSRRRSTLKTTGLPTAGYRTETQILTWRTEVGDVRPRAFFRKPRLYCSTSNYWRSTSYSSMYHLTRH